VRQDHFVRTKKYNKPKYKDFLRDQFCFFNNKYNYCPLLYAAIAFFISSGVKKQPKSFFKCPIYDKEIKICLYFYFFTKIFIITC